MDYQRMELQLSAVVYDCRAAVLFVLMSKPQEFYQSRAKLQLLALST